MTEHNTVLSPVHTQWFIEANLEIVFSKVPPGLTVYHFPNIIMQQNTQRSSQLPKSKCTATIRHHS